MQTEPIRKRSRPMTKCDVAIFVGALVILFCTILAIVVLVLQLEEDYKPPPSHYCAPGKSLSCSPLAGYRIVETIPFGDINGTLLSPYQTTAEAWRQMISSANSTIHIACSYFTLNAST